MSAERVKNEKLLARECSREREQYVQGLREGKRLFKELEEGKHNKGHSDQEREVGNEV